ncbi:MAG: hypothetical protein DMG38_01080 [Acidobacteria bacterium]|nr:MAG: hypothetical protein DMG38_01080 [Acidobacteriota bacterium]
MKPRTIRLTFTVCLCSFLAASACAPFPHHVRAGLTGPQPQDPFAGSATAPGGAQETIVWNQPDLNSGRTVEFSSGYSQDDIDLSTQLCGPASAFSGEWKDVESGKKTPPPLRLIHGWAAASQFAGADFWGTHRYRDWNILLVGNGGFEEFAAPANDPNFTDWVEVQELYVKNPDIGRLLEVEWDSGFFPPEMAPKAGDETVAVGRWDFDCGHEGAAKRAEAQSTGFRSEVHAPGILISSHIAESGPASVRVLYTVFAGSRSGPLDTIPVLFLFQRLWSTHINALGGQDYSMALRAPQDGWKVASCATQEGKPAGGHRKKRIGSQLESKDGGKSLVLTLIAKTFKPSERIERSVIVHVVWVPENSPTGAVKCE